MKRICWQCAVLLTFSVMLAFSTVWVLSANAQSPECPPGFHWDRLSGVGCVQSNCLDITNGKYTYTGSCSCVEGYKGCYEPVDSGGIDCIPFCPTSELVACVAPDAVCPGMDPLPGGDSLGDLPDESLAEPDSRAASNADLVKFLETFLAGENAQSTSPGWGAIASMVTALLLGIWIMINFLPSLTLDDIRSTFGHWGGQTTSSSSVSSTTLPRTSRIKQIYDLNPANFRQCQDMVYGQLWGQPPPDAKGQGKAEIYQKLIAEGYWQADQGGMYDPQGLAAKFSQLQDGDIIMFSDYGLPNERGAHHYAVVANGKIVEILNLPKGGEMNITDLKDARGFFEGRSYQGKVDKHTYKPRPYYGYKVFRK